jgi:glycosyltransferase involved in cell wall biosynthesis
LNPSTPLVSVIVPVFNTEAYLEQCLDSIESQTLREIEIICLNDGSTDGSLDILNAHAAKDDRIIVVDKQNEGYGATCNRGIRMARAEWIALVEPDDWVEPGMFQDLLACKSRYADAQVDVIKSPYWRICFPDTPQEKKLHCDYRKLVRPSISPFRVDEAPSLLSYHPSIWSALYRKGFLEEKGITFREYPGASWADNPFLIETLCQARIIYWDRPYYCYREELPEKTRTVLQTSMPFDRWHEMTDLIEKLGVTSPEILQAHYFRGFWNFSTAMIFMGFENPLFIERASAMFSRMDQSLVLAHPRLRPEQKEKFLKVLGLPPQRFSHLPHYIRQFAFYWRSVGPRRTLGAIVDMLRN